MSYAESMPYLIIYGPTLHTYIRHTPELVSDEHACVAACDSCHSCAI